MSWSTEEWDAFTALLAGWWPGDFTEEAGDAWRLALDGVDPQQAVGALRVLLHEGRRFRPSASELVAVLRQDPDRPTFDEAYELIFGARGLLKAHLLGGESPAVPSLVEAFADRQGLSRLASLPVDDPTWGPKHRKDLEHAWDVHVEAFDGRQVAQVAGGGLRRLGPGLLGLEGGEAA